MVAAAIGIGSAVAGIGGSLLSSSAAKGAADTQAAAAQQASANAMAQYQQTRDDLAPYRAGGGAAFLGEGALFGPNGGNMMAAATGAAPAAGGSAPVAASTPLTASSQAVTDLAGQVSPIIAQAMQSGQATGTLPGGYTYKMTPATPASVGGGYTAGDGFQENNPATPGSFQVFGPDGSPLGTYGTDPSQASAIAGQLALSYGNAQGGGAAGVAPTAGASAAPAGPPSILGLNDPTYGLPSLGETNFFKAMGVNGPQDLAFNPTQDTLNNLPGYQFELNQGLQSTQNSAAARGLGVSGAALKGAAGYAQGLASSDLGNYYNMWNGNLNTLSNVFSNNLLNNYNVKQGAVTNAFNRMNAMAGIGENAAAQTGTLGNASVSNANAALVGGANAQAAGQVGSANALSNGLNGIGSSATNYMLMNSLMKGGGGSPGGYVDDGVF